MAQVHPCHLSYRMGPIFSARFVPWSTEGNQKLPNLYGVKLVGQISQNAFLFVFSHKYVASSPKASRLSKGSYIWLTLCPVDDGREPKLGKFMQNHPKYILNLCFHKKHDTHSPKTPRLSKGSYLWLTLCPMNDGRGAKVAKSTWRETSRTNQ